MPNSFVGYRDSTFSKQILDVAKTEWLTPDDLREMLPSGRQPVFANRVGWAVTYMTRAGLLERVHRAVYWLTDEGGRLLACKHSRVDLDVLRTYPAFVEWSRNANAPSPVKDTTVPVKPHEPAETPEETLDRAARHLREALEADVLDRVREAPPSFLEQVIVDLLIAMGYGGGDTARGRVTGRSGDGGIDGTIREDALGLDEVYVQAKKHADGNTVGEGDLRNFAGAIDELRLSLCERLEHYIAPSSSETRAGAVRLEGHGGATVIAMITVVVVFDTHHHQPLRAIAATSTTANGKGGQNGSPSVRLP